MIMAQSLFIALKQTYPELIIDVLAPAWSEPLLVSMPEVNASIVMSLGHGQLELKKRYQLGKSLRKKQYDWAIVLPNSLKSALVPFWANIPRRTGYKGEMRYGLINDMHHLDKQKLTMTVQRFVALAGEKNAVDTPHYDFPALQVKQSDQEYVLDSFKLNHQLPVLALCPGAEYGSAKCWPAEHYAAVAEKAISENWQVWILGSEKDRAIAKEIKTAVGSEQCLQLAGETTLEQVIILLSLASQVISNDSGLMHIAAAVDSPVIALYGSSDPKFTPPLNSKAQIVTLNMSCSPCFKRECPLEHLKCLQDVSPSFVWKKARVNGVFT
jgi:heptosyltransferase-2